MARKDFQGKPVPTKFPKGARARHLLPKLKTRSKVHGCPREQPTDETWPGKEPSIIQVLNGNVALTESGRNPGKSGILQAQESSRTKESQGKSRQEAPKIPKKWNYPRVYKNKNVQPALGAATPPNPRKLRRPNGRPARGYR